MSNIVTMGDQTASDRFSAPWWIDLVLPCSLCGTEFTVDAEDKRIGKLKLVLRAGQPRIGEYHVGRWLDPDIGIDDEYLISACPVCGSSGVTYRSRGGRIHERAAKDAA